MREESAKPDLEMAEIAERQHGVVSTRQLLGIGINKDGILRRAKAGRLHRIHYGVYAVGHGKPALEGRWMAAVLAIGGGRGSGGSIIDHWGAVLSHRSAAALWGLLHAIEHPIDVAVPSANGRANRRGIRLHRSQTLPPGSITVRNGIPVTVPARTISDLQRVASAKAAAGFVSPRELRRAIRQANVLGLPIGDHGKRDRTRSDLERDFLGLCRKQGLPAPEVNVRVGCHLVDFLWREARLVVETDGYRYHRGRVAFDDDHTRDLDLRAAGFEVVRLTEKQVNEQPARVGGILAAAIGARRQGRVGGEARHGAP